MAYEPAIENFIPDYSSANYEKIQSDITRRYEFYSQRGTTKQKFPKRGEYFSHQEIIANYFIRVSDRILNINEPGTGKTGGFIKAAEFFRDNPGRIKRAIVLQPGDPTIEDFKQQLVSITGKYDTKKVLGSSSEKSRKNNLTRLIGEFYTISGYQHFTSSTKHKTNKEIEEEYSDTIFLLEELHKIRNADDEESGKSLGVDEIYKELWRVLHVAKRIKIMENTGTPHVNEVNDMVPLLNLLLPIDFQLPLKRDYRFATYSQLEPYFRGKITYVRNLDMGVNIVYKGDKIRHVHEIEYSREDSNPIEPDVYEFVGDNIEIVERGNTDIEPDVSVKEVESELVLYKCKMSRFQTEGYNNALRNKDTFHINSRQASLFVYPDGSYGTAGAKKYLIEDKNKFTMSEKLSNYFEGSEKEMLDNLKKFSSKYYVFIKNELKSKGCSYGYMEEIMGSGIILLSLILTKFGFEDFTFSQENPMLINKEGKYTLSENFTKKPRFATITSRTPQTNINTILKLRNCTENRNGDYLKILIVSRMAQVGINIYHTLRSYMFTSTWHKAGMDQALARAVRSNSHNDLIEEYGSVNLETYLLCSYTDEDKKTIDLDNYFSAEEKDMHIKHNFRIMKQTAFDAYLNYKRNVRLTDKNYSRETDYDDKFYLGHKNLEDELYGLAPKKIIYNTYDIYYSEKEINELKNNIKDLVIERKIVSFEDIRTLFPTRDEIFYLTIAELKNDKITLINNFSKIIYINVGNDIVYQSQTNDDSVFLLDKSYEITRPLKLSLFTEKVDFELDDILSELKDSDDVIEILKTKTPPILQKLLEKSIIEISKGSTNPLYLKINKLFYNYSFKDYEPVENIEIAKRVMLETKTGSGRRAKEGSTTKLKNVVYSDKINKNNEKVYFHYYYGEEGTTSYNVTSLTWQINKVRLYKPSEGEFRDASDIEKHVYSYIIRKKVERLMEKYGKNYGGIIYRDNKFRIHSEDNTKNVGSKGIVCETVKKEKVKEFIEKLHDELDLDYDEDEYESKTLKNLCYSAEEILKDNEKMYYSF